MEPKNAVTFTFTSADRTQKVTITITDGQTTHVTFEPVLNHATRRAYYHFAPYLQLFMCALASLNTVSDENDKT